MNLKKWCRLYCLLAGACDATTGLLLAIAPLWTLRLMKIPVMPTEPVYMSFIGAFVAGVGLAYFHPFVFTPAARRDQRLEGVLAATTVVRAAIAVFVVTAVMRGGLHPAWLTVAGSDAVMAALQTVMLKRRVLAEHDA